MKKSWEAYGLSTEEVSTLTSLWTRFYDFVTTGKGRQAYDQYLQSVPKSGPILVRLPPRSSKVSPLFLHLDFGFDPIPVWKRVHCPALLINGEADAMVETQLSIPLFQKALEAARNTDYTIHVFAGANHGIMTHDEKGGWDYAPGYLDYMTTWLEKRVRLTNFVPQ